MKLAVSALLIVSMALGLASCTTETAGSAQSETSVLCVGLANFLRAALRVDRPQFIPSEGTSGFDGKNRCEFQVAGGERLGGAAAIVAAAGAQTSLSGFETQRPASSRAASGVSVYVETSSRTVALAASNSRWKLWWILAPTARAAVLTGTPTSFISETEVESAAGPLNSTLDALA